MKRSRNKPSGSSSHCASTSTSISSQPYQQYRTLRISNLPYWPDESCFRSWFSLVGEVFSTKVIRNKITGHPEGSGFLEFASHATAERILRRYNGTQIPGTHLTLRLNWAFAIGERCPDAVPVHSSFVREPTAVQQQYQSAKDTEVLEARLRYELAKDQSGMMLNGNIPIRNQKLKNVTDCEVPYAAFRVSHSAFLRPYFVDLPHNNMVCESWRTTLRAWIAHRVAVYHRFRPYGFSTSFYRISSSVIHFIRCLVEGIVHMHNRQFCVEGHFGIENVVVGHDGKPKFCGLHLRPIKDRHHDIGSDYINFVKIIKQLLGSAADFNSKCPYDMKHFIQLLQNNPEADEDYVLNHCALWTSNEVVNFLQIFWDDLKRKLNHSRRDKVRKALNKIKELQNWMSIIRGLPRGEMRGIFRWKGKRYRTAVYNLYEFLRNCRVHYKDTTTSPWQTAERLYEDLTATFPQAVCLLQEELNRLNMLTLFMPRPLHYL